VLGVKSLQFWNSKDRELTVVESLVTKIADAIRELTPATVYFPGPLELHPDHRAAGLLVWAALQSLEQEAPQAFSYEIGVQNPVNYLIDISAEREVKQQAMAHYVSQNAQNEYPALVLSLNKARTYTLPQGVEIAEGFYRYSERELQMSYYEVLHRFIERYQDQN
jgi:LmbE family N-acetylglucosaminyl deacetylase